MNLASSEPLRVPQISDIMAAGPLDFAEITSQSLQSTGYE